MLNSSKAIYSKKYTAGEKIIESMKGVSEKNVYSLLLHPNLENESSSFLGKCDECSALLTYSIAGNGIPKVICPKCDSDIEVEEEAA